MYEGLNFSRVKFIMIYPLFTKNVPRNLQNFGDNWPLASKVILSEILAEKLVIFVLLQKENFCINQINTVIYANLNSSALLTILSYNICTPGTLGKS